jgi:CRISPR-associated protein Csd1
MILQALNRYYQLLLDDPEADVAPPGFNSIQVHFSIVLSKEGKLLSLTPLLIEEKRRGKSFERPIRLIVPQRVIRSGLKISANFLWDNETYVLGISDRDEDQPDYSLERFTEFREFNLSLLQKANCDQAEIVSKFLINHDPKTFKQTSLFIENSSSLNNVNLVFKVLGSEGFVHEDPIIQQVWINYITERLDAPIGRCLVTGKKSQIELTHNKIKGIRGGQSSGTAIVSFNDRAYESFNKDHQQGINAPVSTEAMFGYTTALNYLLRSQRQRITLSDTTIVYWAESLDKAYTDLFSLVLNPSGSQKSENKAVRDRKSESLLESLANSIREGKPLDTEYFLRDLDSNIRFFVLGLSPNAARASVRFFYNDPFGKAISNVLAHHQDMAIINEYGDQEHFYSIYQIVRETVSKKSKNQDPSPLLTGVVFRSILMNLPYPAALYNAILIRVRADQDDKKNRIEKINHIRAALIKAFLFRKYRNQNKFQEELQMSLNKDSTNQAYLLGRLFAVMEKAQQDAAEKELNATIKDRYFTSACATPATTFPILLRLTQHHIAKAKYGHTSDRRIQDIMQMLDVEKTPFPKHLTLDEQGIFILGYYHQRVDIYKKKSDPEIDNEED